MLVIGPAGTGKTTMLAMAVDDLRRQGRAVVGLAPSGKAADVLGAEAGCNATTLAKFLYDHDRPDSGYVNRPPEGTTVILDEASMGATDDLDRLVRLVELNRWRLVCVGDPAQLPSVGRGGMFEQWCETVPAHHLEDIRRFVDDWQAVASLQLRRGQPEAATAYGERGRLDTVHPSLVPDRVARLHAKVAARGQTLAITCASTSTARRSMLRSSVGAIPAKSEPRQHCPTAPGCSWVTPSPPAATMLALSPPPGPQSATARHGR